MKKSFSNLRNSVRSMTAPLVFKTASESMVEIANGWSKYLWKEFQCFFFCSKSLQGDIFPMFYVTKLLNSSKFATCVCDVSSSMVPMTCGMRRRQHLLSLLRRWRCHHLGCHSRGLSPKCLCLVCSPKKKTKRMERMYRFRTGWMGLAEIRKYGSDGPAKKLWSGSMSSQDIINNEHSNHKAQCSKYFQYAIWKSNHEKCRLR